jgi:IS5 family transposase
MGRRDSWRGQTPETFQRVSASAVSSSLWAIRGRAIQKSPRIRMDFFIDHSFTSRYKKLRLVL